MKILSYKHIIFATILLLTGCIYGDLDKSSRKMLHDEVTEYCQANHYPFCQIYAQCYSDIFNQLNAEPGSAVVSMSIAVPMVKQKNDMNDKTKNLMDILYSELKYNEKKDKDYLSIMYSYALYPHNRCSSIIGAKQYDLSRYHKAIEESIEKKKSRMNKK